VKKLLVLTAVLLLSVAPAMAENNYVKGKVGYFMPAESILDSGFNLEAAYGLPLQDFVNLPLTAEFGIGYYTASGSESVGFPGFSLNSDIDISVIPFTATVLYDLPVNVENMAFNVGTGLGLYVWNSDFSVSDPFFGNISGSDDGIELGFHLQAGGEYKINDRYAATADLKYAIVSDDLGGTFINVGVKYNF
jgi:hypothetical protein